MNKRDLAYIILHRELGDRFDLNFTIGTPECKRYHELMRLRKADLNLIAHPEILTALNDDYYIDICIH